MPWWLAILLAAGVAAATYAEYRRPLAPLSRGQRAVLAALRATLLATLVLFLFRPIVPLPPSGSRDAIVPVLVDVSRSMRLADVGGRSRIARAGDILNTTLLPALGSHFVTEVYGVGDAVAPISPDRLTAEAKRSGLSSALTAIRERY